ncbi:prophage maintenance system killer protein [Breznakia sp. PF5-3]|uniref:virulence protein RhuM/Fic/DOC family protein n=1 Tax=unclassified Breznakia TaxID=2623764 RepID=UPI002406CB99|nr:MULTISPECIES: virulence protein RhuM/Fic/DOC family protein [unclassified Breznakia]MDF9824944.1 prophage maintenance system killer protein [Breznakia sp. PM6-1]MDF9835788.1 prophage maintenance system killer protein [Breznakia sp. PF5-3]MDF9837918.1 prophage maintenance system killer protein [Breznakia sp. PFB2-8]MDF9859907.1 prophage maintenance system killer protein [Breznakia sp. PH5-24]
MNKKEIVVFKDNDFEINVNLDLGEETVWLTQKEISTLFGKSQSTISEHIANIFKEGELDEIGNIGKTDIANSDKPVKVYNLDVIISVGYRVKSNRGVLFRKWANSILKQYLLDGYVINEKRKDSINYSQLFGLLNNLSNAGVINNITSEGLLTFLNSYQRGLEILDNYDHQTLIIPKGLQDTYKLTYEECIKVIRESSFKDKGDLFAIERDNSFSSSIQTIYQTYDGIELYPTLELKAANLLYLVTKNHSFIDGNKRIAAIMFLYFLNKNNHLEDKGIKRISNETLATLTILIASSKPEDKESIINLIMVLIA